MKIVFLCGSLEPGRDGVGDYVRRLAEELIKQEHQTAAIALNDQHTEWEIIPTAAKKLHAHELPVLRLPANWPAIRRFQRARQWIEEFQPTWVSLQFVPYAFHTKGLPVLLARHLRGIVTGRKVHLMMHEGWVGSESGTELKRKLLSQLQKIAIRDIIRRLQPTVIHTHLPIYRKRLQQFGFQVLPLPLFSNIPVFFSIDHLPDSGIFRVGIFSNAEASGPFVNFLRNLVQDLHIHNLICQVVLMGGEPQKMQALMAILEDTSGLQGNVSYTGFMKPEQLSAIIRNCHLGLTPVPRSGLGKSGSVAAFLAHGIPVAAPNVLLGNSEEDIGFFSASLCSAILIHPGISSFQQAKASAYTASSLIDISVVARTFLEDLTIHGNQHIT